MLFKQVRERKQTKKLKKFNSFIQFQNKKISTKAIEKHYQSIKQLQEMRDKYFSKNFLCVISK